MNDPICSVNRYEPCDHQVEWEVFLGEEADYTCPVLCDEHKRQDQEHGSGWWTNQCEAHGNITYRRILS